MIMENVFIPDNLKFSSDCEYYQAMANNITRTMGNIDWTDTGPVVGNMNVSYCFLLFHISTYFWC